MSCVGSSGTCEFQSGGAGKLRTRFAVRCYRAGSELGRRRKQTSLTAVDVPGSFRQTPIETGAETPIGSGDPSESRLSWQNHRPATRTRRWTTCYPLNDVLHKENFDRTGIRGPADFLGRPARSKRRCQHLSFTRLAPFVVGKLSAPSEPCHPSEREGRPASRHRADDALKRRHSGSIVPACPVYW